MNLILLKIIFQDQYKLTVKPLQLDMNMKVT
jgi:hypothetical protein